MGLEDAQLERKAKLEALRNKRKADDTPLPLREPAIIPFETVEGLGQMIVNETKEMTQDDEPLDLSLLQSKKPNWDLKRDLDRKLEPLEQKTQAIIVELIRQRLRGDISSIAAMHPL